MSRPSLYPGEVSHDVPNPITPDLDRLISCSSSGSSTPALIYYPNAGASQPGKRASFVPFFGGFLKSDKYLCRSGVLAGLRVTLVGQVPPFYSPDAKLRTKFLMRTAQQVRSRSAHGPANASKLMFKENVQKRASI